MPSVHGRPTCPCCIAERVQAHGARIAPPVTESSASKDAKVRLAATGKSCALWRSPLTKSWIKTLRDMGAERDLRGVGRHVHSAADEAVDQCPDDFRPGHRLSAFPSYVRRQPVEIHDLPLEQHNG